MTNECPHGIAHREWCTECSTPTRQGQDYWAHIKEAIPVEYVVEALGGEVIRYQRNGVAVVTCPIHGDTHASAIITSDGQGFKCFTCDVRGSIFDLLIAAGEAKDFKGALRWLERNALLPETGTTTSSSGKRGRGTARSTTT